MYFFWAKTLFGPHVPRRFLESQLCCKWFLFYSFTFIHIHGVWSQVLTRSLLLNNLVSFIFFKLRFIYIFNKLIYYICYLDHSYTAFHSPAKNFSQNPLSWFNLCFFIIPASRCPEIDLSSRLSSILLRSRIIFVIIVHILIFTFIQPASSVSNPNLLTRSLSPFIPIHYVWTSSSIF